MLHQRPVLPVDSWNKNNSKALFGNKSQIWKEVHFNYHYIYCVIYLCSFIHFV